MGSIDLVDGTLGDVHSIVMAPHLGIGVIDERSKAGMQNPRAARSVSSGLESESAGTVPSHSPNGPESDWRSSVLARASLRPSALGLVADVDVNVVDLEVAQPVQAETDVE